jgi:hypothetical protein
VETGEGWSVLASDSLSLMPYEWISDDAIFAARSYPATQEFLPFAEVSLADHSQRIVTERYLSWPDLHPGGDLIAGFDRGDRTLRLTSRNGSTDQEFPVPQGDAASFSPNGKWLALRSDGNVMVMSFPSGERMELIAGPPAEQPRWSTNGDALF